MTAAVVGGEAASAGTAVGRAKVGETVLSGTPKAATKVRSVAPTSSAPAGGSAGKARTKRKPASKQASKPASSPADKPKPTTDKGPALLAKPPGGLGLAGNGRQVIIAEMVLCLVIVALAPLTDRHKLDSPATGMKRLSAVAGLFLLLALVSAGGKGAARVAAAVGGLVTVTLLVSERDVFVVLAKRFRADANASPPGPPADDYDPASRSRDGEGVPGRPPGQSVAAGSRIRQALGAT